LARPRGRPCLCSYIFSANMSMNTFAALVAA